MIKGGGVLSIILVNITINEAAIKTDMGKPPIKRCTLNRIVVEKERNDYKNVTVGASIRPTREGPTTVATIDYVTIYDYSGTHHYIDAGLPRVDSNVLNEPVIKGVIDDCEDYIIKYGVALESTSTINKDRFDVPIQGSKENWALAVISYEAIEKHLTSRLNGYRLVSSEQLPSGLMVRSEIVFTIDETKTPRLTILEYTHLTSKGMLSMNADELDDLLEHVKLFKSSGDDMVSCLQQALRYAHYVFKQLNEDIKRRLNLLPFPADADTTLPQNRNTAVHDVVKLIRYKLSGYISNRRIVSGFDAIFQDTPNT